MVHSHPSPKEGLLNVGFYIVPMMQSAVTSGTTGSPQQALAAELPMLSAVLALSMSPAIGPDQSSALHVCVLRNRLE